MLRFEPFSFDALKRVLPYIKSNTSLNSDISAGGIFMWQEGYDVQFCVWNDTFIMRENIGEQPAFSWPVGADVDGMINELIEYVRANNLALRFCEIDDNTLKIISTDLRLKPMMSECDERWSDYIYSFEEALTFKGNKYKGQRNHINKFKRLYGEPIIRFLNKDDMPKIRAFLDEYKKSHKDAEYFEKLEFEQTRKLLEIYSDLGLYAACLEIDGDIAAFTIGEVVNDMLIIHIEKALTKYDGVYPTMYSGFVNLICEHSGRPLNLINREDDSGDEGLRISKMQYHPVCRANKYLVHINSPASKLDKIPVIDSKGIVLTEFRESDKKAYLELNTDIYNNRYWGYDYSQDEDILGKIDENTFYDFTMQDMRAGDSINFVVRESVFGEMIGEAILWNFTYGGSAEIGCRLFPSFQGKGLGKAAFKVLTDFAEKTLNLKPVARCYIENTVSYRMIKACGFDECGKDNKYFYFKRNTDYRISKELFDDASEVVHDRVKLSEIKSIGAKK